MSSIVTEPVYKQLQRICHENLDSGSYSPGDRFPSERELAAEHGVSRATANKVIAGLVAERRLEHRPGIGTFVLAVPNLNASLREVRSFTTQALSQGKTPQTRVLRFETLPYTSVPREVVQSLCLEDDEDALFVERLRLADGEAVILEERWIRAALVPGLEARDLEGSFYGILEARFDLVPTGEQHHIRAINVGADAARKLGIKRGAAVLRVEGPGFNSGGQTIWHQILLYRGDRYQFENTISAQGVEPPLLRMTPEKS